MLREGDASRLSPQQPRQSSAPCGAPGQAGSGAGGVNNAVPPWTEARRGKLGRIVVPPPGPAQAGDSGNYCCYAVEVSREGHGKPHTLQVAHGFVELQVQRGKGGLQNCTFHTATGKDITAAALATGACIVGILCLPLILLLIYKQRQAASSRRAHELVRMDRAQGIENPVFEAGPAGSAEPRARTPLHYAAGRLPSESGRHLLSEPSTPLSPPGPGDCFFPTL
ncbi:hypothetical protein EK904_015125, partial [Melospiza melodia maxima]